MSKRYALAKGSIFDDCLVTPEAYEGVLERLADFITPYVEHLPTRFYKHNAFEYVKGLLSDTEKKNVESIAYLLGYGRQQLQKFIGQREWNDEVILDKLTKQIVATIGRPNGIIVFDPTSFPKKGKASVGVARQWCGRLGKIENCQVATFMAYVTEDEFALIDRRLYLPEEWIDSPSWCNKAGIPKRHQVKKTRHTQALEMLDGRGKTLPHQWVAGDDEMGKIPWFRKALRERGESYLLAVPSNILVKVVEPPPDVCDKCGKQHTRDFVSLKEFVKSIPASEFKTVKVRLGHKGWLRVKLYVCQVLAKIEGEVGDEETLVISKWIDDDKKHRCDSYLGWSDVSVNVAEYGRVIKSAYRIEECFKRAKSECGLSDYQVRNWRGWHHHVTLSQLTLWFLTEELLHQKKTHR